MEREIYIFDRFCQDMAQSTIKQMLDFDRQGKDPIKVYINSYGGDVTALFSILDTMALLKSPVYTIAIGEADSAAAWLLSAGARRFVTSNTRVMIHEVSSLAIGTNTDMQEQLAQAAAMNSRLIEILAKNTKQPAGKIRNDVKKQDYYMTASEAVEYGIADEVLNAESKDIYKLSDPVSFGQSEVTLGEKLSEIQILKTGKFKHIQYGDFEISSADLGLFKAHFDERVRGIDISVDATHDNDNGERAAEGWIQSVEIRNQSELWAWVEFTAQGRQLIAEKRFKYFSPEFLFSYKNEKGEIFKNVLLGGTLTNRPFIKGMSAIKLSEPAANKEKHTMNKEELIAKLSEHGVNVMALTENLSKLTAENQQKTKELETVSAKSTKIEAENKTLTEKVSELSGKIEADAKAVCFEDLKRVGKVVEANREKIFAKFATADELKSFYADIPALLNVAPKGDAGANDAPAIDSELEAKAKTHGLSKEDILAAQK
ncbi:MAG: ATP-dependent Clp protease proteolytic subunit [Elusimicrobiaceae bacterium]